MYDWDLQVVPGPPKADLKRRMLEEWLRNPFLDDDVKALCSRLGSPETEVAEALTGLCEAGFLRAAGTGYALSLDQADSPRDEAPALGAPGPGETTLAGRVPDEILVDAGLVDALPFGLLVLRPTGTADLANDKAAAMLGVPLADLDGKAFERVTGVDPLIALDHAEPLSFSLIDPPALEVTLQGRRLPSGPAILIMVRDVSLLEEVSHIQAEAQEELYDRLKEELVQPLGAIEKFLEDPGRDGLARARLAMEQINGFLQEFFLQGGRDGRPAPMDS